MLIADWLAQFTKEIWWSNQNGLKYGMGRAGERPSTIDRKIKRVYECFTTIKEVAVEQVGFFALHPGAIGVLLLLAYAFFPRITMLAAGVVFSFHALGWLGWIFAPHLTVAILATTYFWHTNPVLCVLAWIVALGGTSAECGSASRIKNRSGRNRQ